MDLLTTIVAIPVLLAGCVAAAFAAYLIVLTIAALFYRHNRLDAVPEKRLIVLIPAHDETLLIARCVRSLIAQSYPRRLFEVVVIADNCTDNTAELARAAGAGRVLVRDVREVRGKGHALRWALDQLLAPATGPDAVVVVDADTVADRDFLIRLVEPFAMGADVVQADDLLDGEGSGRSALRAAAFLLVNRVRPRGRSVLGLPASLVGNGMLFSAQVLRDRPWSAFTAAEDLEYALDLHAHGVNIAFAGDARLRAQAAPNEQAAAVQQLRWEGGRAHLVRARAGRLVLDSLRHLRLSSLLTAIDLSVPPLGMLAAGLVAGTAVVGGLGLAGVWPLWLVTPWLVGFIVIPFHVLIGFRAGDAPKSAYRALWHAPLFILAKPLQTRRIVRFEADTWVRTERADESAGGAQ